MSILESATSVFRLMTRSGRSLTVSDVAEGLSLPKSSVSRLLKQMLGCGLLERDAATLAYGPSLLMLELGRLVQASSPVPHRMENALQELVAATGHTGYISVLDSTRQNVVVLRVFHGKHALRVVTEPGERGIATATSTGRALLARLDDAHIDALVDKVSGKDRAAALAGLKTRLRQVRAQGWAVAIDESLPGVGSVSCAVGDPSSGETWAFCLSFPAVLAEQAGFVERLVAPLVERARALGLATGDVAWQSVGTANPTSAAT